MEKKILLANKKVIYMFLYVPFIRVEAVRDERFTTSPVGQLTQEHFYPVYKTASATIPVTMYSA